MLTLGIWSFGPDSSAVLLDDTSVLAAIEEEKLNRSSGAGGIPRLAIKWCLEQHGVNLSDVEIVAFPGRLLRKRSEEHTSEPQSHLNLVCRLLLEKKKNP